MPEVVVIVGGGYAGLACLIELTKKAPHLELHLIDCQSEHTKITNLHKTFVKPVADFKVPYAELAKRFGFTFHQHRLNFNMQELEHWQQTKRLPVAGGDLAFDYLVVSTGACPALEPKGSAVFGLSHLTNGKGPALFDSWMIEALARQIDLSIVGAGATGLQVLFELNEKLHRKRVDCRLRLIELGSKLAPQLPEKANDYILSKLEREGIEYLPKTRFLKQKDGKIYLADLDGAYEYTLSSTATLLFPGVKPEPVALKSNSYGQVRSDNQILPDIFSAGDCSDFDGQGYNQLTAQAAVRKGKLVAHNIHNLIAGRGLRRYRYQEKGYLLSLGSVDAVGWLLLPGNRITGFAANILKEGMESQYDLYLDGVDTYFGFP